MPIIWFKPVEKFARPLTGFYSCPVYKTLLRAGTLSTTGHSTNYVLTVYLPTDREESYWIKRGVAMFCALNY